MGNSQKLSKFNFEWVEDTSQFNEDFTKKLCEKSEKGYILEVDVKYPKELNKPQNDLPFLLERNKLGKVEKLVSSLEDKIGYAIHIKSLKQALNRRLVLKKVHRVISFNQDEWWKPYIEMNNKIKTEAKNAVFGKTWKT